MHAKNLLAYSSFILGLGTGALAQRPMAVCEPGWEWNRNSLNQDPCTVGSKLDAFCRNRVDYQYDKLDKGGYYSPPSKNITGDVKCDCNTVIYSLIMACTSCQEGLIYPWSTFYADCDTVYISQFPTIIPQGTAIPRWALFDVTTLPNGTYSDQSAESIGRDPEELPPQPNTSTTSGKPDSTGAVNSGSSKHNDTGAIVGGVIGGATALTVTGIVIFYLVRSSRKDQDGNVQPQFQYQGTPSGPWQTSPTSPTYNPSLSSGPTVPQNPPIPTQNPVDPSTRPPPENRRPITYVTPITSYGGGR